MKPTSRIEEIEEELKKQYFPMGRDGEHTTAQLARINARAIGIYLDEQSENEQASDGNSFGNSTTPGLQPKPQEEPKCCDACRPGGAGRDGVDICRNKNCPCHQKQEEQKEDERVWVEVKDLKHEPTWQRFGHYTYEWY